MATSGDHPPSLPPRFEWLRQLGHGAHGAVHAAHDHEAERLVALKLVPLPALGDDPALREERLRALASESQAARRLVHPHIGQVWDCGIHGDLYWIAMEPVPGVPLSRYTLPSRLLPATVVAQLGAQLADALAHAHGARVLHRDIKPANVLVQWPAAHARLIDFGLARLDDGSVTRSGMFIGSPAYMAPELAAGAVPSAASDLYALGASLFELLSGQHPYPATSLGEWLQQIARHPAPDLLTVAPQVPPPLGELVGRLLAREPAQRPADAREVAAALRR